MLKGRFQSLKELRIQISLEKTHEFAKLWIICCIILHNIIIDIKKASNRWIEHEADYLYQEGREEYWDQDENRDDEDEEIGGDEHVEQVDLSPEELF